LGISTKTLYNWLRKGRIPEPNRNPITRYRLWTPKDVDRIRQLVTGAEASDV
jgi:DNA-binding transcriptional MerR regulator